VHIDRTRRAARKIERHASRKWTAIVDDNDDRLSITGIRHRDARPEGERAMRSRESAGIESFASRGSMAGPIEGRNDVLPGTRSVGFCIMREKPAKAPAVSLVGGQRRKNQSNNEYERAHGTIPIEPIRHV
jgi:hypothetical protein